MMSSKIAILSLLKIKLFENNGFHVIVFVHNFTNKYLSLDSNYIVDLVMRPKFGNSSIPMREVIEISILKGFDQKNFFL